MIILFITSNHRGAKAPFIFLIWVQIVLKLWYIIVHEITGHSGEWCYHVLWNCMINFSLWKIYEFYTKQNYCRLVIIRKIYEAVSGWGPSAFLKKTYPNILVPKFSWHKLLFAHKRQILQNLVKMTIESQKTPDFDRHFVRKKSGKLLFKAKFLSNYHQQPYSVIHG